MHGVQNDFCFCYLVHGNEHYLHANVIFVWNRDNSDFTVWKFQDFCVIHILREINSRL